jgi:hypothetical protein
MVSNVCFVPEERLGIAILTNNDNQNLFELLRLQILDDYLGVPYKNRSKMALERHNTEMQDQVTEIASWNKLADEMHTHTLDLNQYVGKYLHELYGEMSIEKKGNQLRATFHTHPDLSASLRYMGGEDWLITYNNVEFGVFKVTFDMDKKNVKGLNVKVNDFVEYDAYKFNKI